MPWSAPGVSTGEHWFVSFGICMCANCITLFNFMWYARLIMITEKFTNSQSVSGSTHTEGSKNVNIQRNVKFSMKGDVMSTPQKTCIPKIIYMTLRYTNLIWNEKIILLRKQKCWLNIKAFVKILFRLLIYTFALRLKKKTQILSWMWLTFPVTFNDVRVS